MKDRPRIFLLGSCASRDALEVWERPFELTCYLARTSLASAFQEPADQSILELAESLSSSFQKRMVRTDLSKKAERVISAGIYDVLILDLIDERFDLAVVPSVSGKTTLATLSAEFSGVIGAAAMERIPLGDSRRWESWCRGVDRLFEITKAPVVLNKVCWAERTETGDLVPRQQAIKTNNSELERMYEYICSHHEVLQISYESEFTSESQHKWGIAPFHYTKNVYAEMLGQLSGHLCNIL